MNFQKYSDNLVAATILPAIPRSITPNQVSYLRIVCVPFIFYLLEKEMYLPGLILFAFASLTDMVDGAMARKRDQETELGKTLDALADRGLIALAAFIFIPKYFGWTLLSAMIILELANTALAYKTKIQMGVAPGANWAGKVKMILQCFGFGFIFLVIMGGSPINLKIAGALLYAGLFFTFLQLFFYPKK